MARVTLGEENIAPPSKFQNGRQDTSFCGMNVEYGVLTKHSC